MVEALPKGTILHCGKQIYELTEEICRGGTAILYSATLRDQNGKSAAELVIKEACPADSAFRYVRREDGVICPETESDEASFRLEQCREALKQEAKKGDQLFNQIFRAVKIETILSVESIELPGKKTSEFKVGQFGCLHSTLQKGTYISDLLPSIDSLYDLSRMTEKILEALTFFHEASWVHGDLSPKNILLEKYKDGPLIGAAYAAYLIDLGSSFPVHGPGPDAATDEIPYLLSTGLYAAPEMYENPVRLTRAADIYAVGCIMLKALGLLPTHDPDTDLFLMIKSDLDTKLKEFGGTPPAIQKAKEILKKALNQDPATRFPTAMEMLKDVTGLVEMLAPETHFPSMNLATSEDLYEAVLCNRASDLRDIDAAFRHANVYFLHGMGGVGKSQLALAYALSRYPQRALRLFYQTSLKDTISNLSCSAGSAKSEDERYNAKLDYLRKHCQDALIIIDNLSRNRSEWINDPAFLDIQNLPAKIIFTTRGNPQDDRFPAKRLRPPEPEDMLEYFCQRLGSDAMKKMKQHLGLSTMDDLRSRIFILLEKVHFHPLCCEIMAKTLRRNTQCVTLEQLEAAFQDLHNSGLPKITFTKDVTQEELDVYHHLVRLFELQGLNESETVLLKRAFLLPESGMQERLFLGEEADSDLLDSYDQLVDGSLLNCNDGIVSIHPLIREVIHELQPALADCESYLNAQYDQWDPDAYSNVQTMQLGELFHNAHNAFETPDQNFSFYAAVCYLFSNSHIADAMALANNYANANQTAKAYELLGDVYDTCGKYQLAHVNYRKALDLALVADPVDFSVVADVYTSLANIMQSAQMVYVRLLDANSSDKYSSAAIALMAVKLLQLDEGLNRVLIENGHQFELEALQDTVGSTDPASLPKIMHSVANELAPLYLSIASAVSQRITSFGLDSRFLNPYIQFAVCLSNFANINKLVTKASDPTPLPAKLLLASNAILETCRPNSSLLIGNLISIGNSYYNACLNCADDELKGLYLYYTKQAVAAAEKKGDISRLVEAYASLAGAFADVLDEDNARLYAQLAYEQADLLPVDPPVDFHNLRRSFFKSGWALPIRNRPVKESVKLHINVPADFGPYHVTLHPEDQEITLEEKVLFDLQYWEVKIEDVELMFTKMLRHDCSVTITKMPEKQIMTPKALLKNGLEQGLFLHQIEYALILSGISSQRGVNPLIGLKYLLTHLQDKGVQQNLLSIRTYSRGIIEELSNEYYTFVLTPQPEIVLIEQWLSAWFHYHGAHYTAGKSVISESTYYEAIEPPLMLDTSMTDWDCEKWRKIVSIVESLDLGDPSPLQESLLFHELKLQIKTLLRDPSL